MSETAPTPAVNDETRPFWDAAGRERLLIKRCKSCGDAHWYPRTKCPFCHSLDTEWVESSGRGVIYSFSTMRRVDPPYCLAYVTLDEGVTLLTNLVECDFDRLAIGQPVEVLFRATAEEGVKVPYFRPA